ncbi:MAG: ATP-binding protein [Deltaproteobacteria bacterium]|nr:ATP-binding protein [Deltaproteobacteria bacterium]
MKEIVLSQKFERDELLEGRYVQREGLKTATESLESSLIKVIIGPRRAGKSVFSIQMLKGQNFAYLNFDDERLASISDYDELLKAIRQVYGETKVVLFDEIQNLPHWELFVNRLHRRGFNIIITGSNAYLLSRELSTHLTGRYVQFRIFPFSFLEFLRAKEFAIDEALELKEKQGLLLSHLDDYLDKGGYPEIVVKGLSVRNYLTTLFESVLFKDIVKRYSVRYSKMLSDLAHYLVTNHSNEFSYTKLKNILAFRSVHTVENYTKYLNEAFLLFFVDRFSFKLKEQMRSPKKVYGYDTGVINAIKFKTGRDIGRLMENLVAVELMRREVDSYYYKSVNGKEVDFVIKQRQKVTQLIQVCYDVDHYATKKRELASLTKAGKDLGCDQLTILTWDYQGEEKHADTRVNYLPLWRWLLMM